MNAEREEQRRAVISSINEMFYGMVGDADPRPSGMVEALDNIAPERYEVERGAITARGPVEPADDRDYGGEMQEDAMPMQSVSDPGLNKIRNFSVRELNCGFIVKVGCHEFAFETPERAGEMITQYLKDPQGTEAKWFDNKLSTRRNR